MNKTLKKEIVRELESAGYTALATFLIVIITSFANSTSINWDGAAVVSVLLIAARSALKVLIPVLSGFVVKLTNGKK